MVDLITACAYMRSSGFSRDDWNTWERQRDAIQASATSLGYQIIHEFREDHIAGKSDAEDRPAFQEMISTLLSNGCRTIFVESLDRLAREYRIQEQLIIYLASKGLTLIAANTQENITDAMMGDPMRRALVQIQGIFAELDKNLIIVKLRKARIRKKSLTGRCEGRKPFGSWPGEQDVLKRIMMLALDKHDSYSIAELLNADGIKARYGGKWHGGTVSKIIWRLTHKQGV